MSFFRAGVSLSPLMGLVLAVWLAFAPNTVVAAPSRQLGAMHKESVVAPLLVGQPVYDEMAKGEVASFEVVLLEDANYLISAVDTMVPKNFYLRVSDAEGNVFFDDLFENPTLALEAGTITVTFTARVKGTLQFLVVGDYGELTDSLLEPGQLFPGSFYVENDVDDLRNAYVTIPPTEYPQEVLIYLAATPAEIHGYVRGPNVPLADGSSAEGDSLTFWSYGGDYRLLVDSAGARTDISVGVFVGGQPPSLVLDTPTDGRINVDSTQDIFELHLDTAYRDLELTLESDEALSIILLDNYYEPSVYANSNSEHQLEIETLEPGVYYVLIEAPVPVGENVSFTLNASGVALEAGVEQRATPQATPTAEATPTAQPTPTDEVPAPVEATPTAAVGDTGGGQVPDNPLHADEMFQDTVEANKSKNYKVTVDAASRMLTVSLIEQEGNELELSVTGQNDDGTAIDVEMQQNGSQWIASTQVNGPAILDITVSSSSPVDTSFFLETKLSDPAGLVGQWVATAKATSRYSSKDYSEKQIVGSLNGFLSGLSPLSWAPNTDEVVHTITLTYASSVTPAFLDIYESTEGGGIAEVHAYDAANDEWVILYKGAVGEVGSYPHIFSPPLTEVDFATNTIRLIVDSRAIAGWQRIDAVRLIGRP